MDLKIKKRKKTAFDRFREKGKKHPTGHGTWIVELIYYEHRVVGFNAIEEFKEKFREGKEGK